MTVKNFTSSSCIYISAKDWTNINTRHNLSEDFKLIACVNPTCYVKFQMFYRFSFIVRYFCYIYTFMLKLICL